jgi:formylglycine-generating enzyme
MKRYSRINSAFIFIILVFIAASGCPMLPLDGLNNPVDPDAEDYQGGVYLVTFDSQGGSTNISKNKVVRGGTAYGVLPVPTKAGLLFGDWWTEPGGNGSWIHADTVVSLKNNITLYANWGDFTVTFNSQGGSTPEPETKVVLSGNPYGTLAVPRKGGYNFNEWWTESDGGGTQITSETVAALAEDHMLYAKWEKISYTVTYVLNSGINNENNPEVYTIETETITLSDPTRAGYYFSGWFEESTCSGSEITEIPQGSIGDQRLYAKWEPLSYTVTFDSQGGSTANPQTKLVTNDEPYGELAITNKEGYTVGGWWTEPNGGGSEITSSTVVSLTQNQTLYAKWGIPMTYVEGGSFQMGSDSGYSNEQPVHTVRVDSFYIGTYEITQDIYEEVMGSNLSEWKGDCLPVEWVTWYEAVQFCNALSREEGRQEAYTISGTNVSVNWESSGYRLPTEAEWEYAARGGAESQGYTYAGSNTVGDAAWYSDNSVSRTHPVGERQANELGLYDMSGNVWEWCWDWYDSSSYGSSPTANPKGPSSGSSRVLRGGSWYNSAQSVRTANRGGSAPSYRYDIFGFRVLAPAE